MTKLYHFSKETGEYLGESNARLDPIEKKPLIPAGAVTDKPPKAAKGKAVIRDGDSWQQITDKRGTKFFDPAGGEHVLQGLHEELPEWALMEKPEEVEPEPNELETLKAALAAKGILTDSDMQTAKAALKAAKKKAVK